MLKKILLIMLTGTLAYGCYDPLEINTENISKVEIPLKFAAPLMDGSFTLEFDSLFNVEEVGDSIITYVDGRAMFKYDTLLDFYDELSEFLNMDDVDFGKVTAFDEQFTIDIEMPNLEFNYIDSIDVGPDKIGVDTTIIINPQDTFKTKYGNNSIFIMPSNAEVKPLEILDVGNPIELSLPYDVYRVDIESGKINLNINHSHINTISENTMTMTPSVHFQHTEPADPPLPAYVIDTTFSEEFSIPIYQGMPILPTGILVRALVKITSLKHVVSHQSLDTTLIINTLDADFSIDLSDYYYYSDDGAGKMDFDVQAYFDVTSPEDTAMVPLPDTLYFSSGIEDLAFDHIVFNYEKDTAMSGRQEIEFDAFSSLPENLSIEGFRLSNPELSLSVESNLGFAALFDIDSLMFLTTGEPYLITDDGTARLSIPNPIDPDNSKSYVQPGQASLILDSATSRLDEVNLIDVNGLLLSYNVVINPDDEAGMAGKHNFFYKYSQDIAADMYDVKLRAEVVIPFVFKFDRISFPNTIAIPFDANDMDSTFYFSDDDSISLDVKMLTKDFPFSATAQFYFDAITSDGLVHIDSMFDEAKELLPSSMDGTWDSTEVWSLVINDQKYQSIKDADSITIDIVLSMDEDEYFSLEKEKTVDIGYKFSLGESSFIITQE